LSLRGLEVDLVAKRAPFKRRRRRYQQTLAEPNRFALSSPQGGSMAEISPEELRMLARQGIAAEIERLNALLKSIEEVTNQPVVEPPRRSPPGRRTMSAAQRKAHSDRMKAYWAKRRG
jgi:hypothetical protein